MSRVLGYLLQGLMWQSRSMAAIPHRLQQDIFSVRTLRC